MLASVLLLIPVLLCGGLGASVGYLYRYRLQVRRVLTVLIPLLVFVVVEVASGALSGKYTLKENLTEQLALVPPFVFLYLLPAVFGSFFVARRFRQWWD